jgi:L-aminopeptidase/D-esterase-like protein
VKNPDPTTEHGDGSLMLDLPGLRIGIGEYPTAGTGCTVFRFEPGATCAVDARGGSPGTVMATDGPVDAICFAGGSVYGLEAASGVASALFEERGFATSWDRLALVKGAIIYDFPPRDNAVYPDHALGAAACRSARTGSFPLGRRGAGRSATVGKCFGPDGREYGGQGGAWRRFGDTTIAVFTVVNSIGAIVDRSGTVVRGQWDEGTSRRLPVIDDLERRLASGQTLKRATGNTTLTLVVTDQVLGPRHLAQLARQVHTSMARAIHPFQTMDDGDVLFAVSTQSVADDRLGLLALATVASELAWDAVLAALPAPGARDRGRTSSACDPHAFSI